MVEPRTVRPPRYLDGVATLEISKRSLLCQSHASWFSGTGGPGRGGDLTVNATDTISLSGSDSDSNPSGLSSTTVNKGDAGKLSVSVPLLQIDGGRISANTFGAGNAGNLDVQVGQLTLRGGGK